MRIQVINGPNLNLLGEREPNIYGNKNYQDFCNELYDFANEHNVILDIFQSNHEGKLVDKIQETKNNFDAIILNAAAFTHYSIAICDAIKSIAIPTLEVHISNIYQREEFRHKSVIANACIGQISGLGLFSYKAAILYFLEKNKNPN